MTCKYIFKGHLFDTEEELNDFLLDTENSTLEKDIVYSLTSTLRHYGEKFNLIQKEYLDLKDNGIQVKSKELAEEVEPEDLDDVGTVKYPYISVTDLIHTIPGRFTNQAFPIFISDNYWKEKFEAYKVGNFDKYEVLFILDLITKKQDGSYEGISNPDILNKIRDRIEGEIINGVRKGGLWKLQALCGNLVHEMFSRFYRDTIPYEGLSNEGKNLFDLSVKNGYNGTWKDWINFLKKDNQLFEEAKSNGFKGSKELWLNSLKKTSKGSYLYLLKDSPHEILNYFKKNIRKEFKPYISDSVLESIIKQCIQLDNELRRDEKDGGYGKNAYIRTELAVIGNLLFETEGNKITKVIGKIDLIAVSDTGRVGIIDFKCSPKDYTVSNISNDPMLYNSAKILTFKYLLECYRKILKSMGVNPPGDIDLYVVPLKFEDFKMENGKVSFSGISSLGDNKTNSMLLKLSNSSPGNERSNIETTLDLVFPKDSFIKTSLETTEVIATTRKVMKEWAPIKEKDLTTEGCKEYIAERGGIKFNELNGLYLFKPNATNDAGLIEKKANSEEEATVKIIEELKKRGEWNENYPRNTANSIREYYNEYYYEGGDDPIDTILKGFISRESTSRKNSNYIKSALGKYSDTNIWKPVPEKDSITLNAILDQFGILMFENKQTHCIDIIRISALYDPSMKVKLPKGNYILGAFLSDLVSHNSADSLTMVSTRGNLELIETMLVINLMKGIFSDDFSGIGNIKLLCPSQLVGLEVPNELLLYNFSRLCALKPSLIENNFKISEEKGTIKVAKYLDILKQDFEELLLIPKSDKNGLYSLDRELKESVSKFDWHGKTLEEIKDKLMELDKKLVAHYNEVTLNLKDRLDYSTPQDRLHKDILYAIAELSGIKMVQQLEQQKKLDVNLNVKSQDVGLGGTMVDNPGTLLSTILNQATNQVTIAYQNTRDSVLKFDLILKQKIKKLKEKKNFGWLKLNITSNLVSELYYNMYDHSSSEIKFINPWEDNTLTSEEKEFLKYAIIKINSTRYNGLNLDKMLENPDLMKELIEKDSKYLLVPLTKGDYASEVAIRLGILNFIRDRFKYLTIWKLETRDKIKSKIEDKLRGFISDNQAENIHKGDLWEAINTMSDLDKDLDRRERFIGRKGKEYFEYNLETILLKQHSAYVMAEELNKVFPIILSLLIHLNSQGAVLNTQFTNDVEYLMNYIKNRVHNLPLEERGSKEALGRDIIHEVMKVSSRLALAFNPRMAYLFLDGIWQDIKLFVKLPDGTTAFTRENLFLAWKFVMADLFSKFGDDRSITELLNIKYGINDMDMNTYIDRIKSDNTGLFTHFWDTGFRFASRPDYYNRMTIFIAQMRADGSFKAHSIKDGKLVYNWTEDERFKAFANNDKSNMEKYNEALSNYITLARQLVEEGVRNEDGTLFKLDLKHPQPLPKAYSNKESEGRKAFSDRIYGYYAHEKKSMFNSTLVGSMMMLMNTYWSAKKNLYILLRSYTLEGYYTDYIEDGVLYFWKLDESTGELIPTTEKTELPIKVWKGRPLEGIIITLLNIGKAFTGNYEGLEEKGLKGVKELFRGENIDPDLRRLYSANFRLLLYDLIMLLLLGTFASWLSGGLKEYAKEHPNKDFYNAMTNTTFGLGVSMLNSSILDLNPGESIFGRGVQWTPFSILSAKNVVNQYKNWIKGNQDFYDAIIKTSAATRGTTPIWEYVKLNTIGTKIGEKEKK